MTTPVLSTATLALEQLLIEVQAGVALRVPVDPPAIVFGWRQAPQQINQGSTGASRIVISPGDKAGKIGAYSGAKLPGRNPNPLATLGELATIYLWAVDAVDVTDLGQYRVARRLHDLVVPILIRKFKGRWALVSSEWLRPELERKYGAEMALTITVEAYVPDDVDPTAPGGTVTSIKPTIAAISGSGIAENC